MAAMTSADADGGQGRLGPGFGIETADPSAKLVMAGLAGSGKSADTAEHSRLRAPAIGSASAEVVQGQWLLRSFLALFEAGIDRAFLYVSRDDCTGDLGKCPKLHQQFSTAGILRVFGLP